MTCRKRGWPPCAVLAVLALSLTWGCATGGSRFKERNVERLSVPPVEEIHLSNGLTILLIENHQVPYVAVRSLTRSGAFQDPIGRAGTADLMSALISYGTETRSEEQIGDEVDRLGASLGTATSRSSLQVHGDVTTANPTHLRRFFALFCDVLRNPTFPAQALDRVRKRKLGDLLSMRDHNSSLASRAFHLQLYEGHPLGRTVSGTPQSLERITREDLVLFHRRHVVPEQTLVGVAGDMDRATLEAWAQEFLGDPDWGADGDGRICVPHPEKPGTCAAFQLDGEIQTNAQFDMEPVAPSKSWTGLRVVVIDKEDPSLNQVQWRLGHQGSIVYDHPSWYAWRLSTQLLGGDFTARLNQILRVREGLTYGAHLLVGHASRVPGSVVVSTYVTPDNLVRAVELAIQELERALNEPIPDEEIASFQSKLIEGFPFRFETPSATLAEHISLRASDLTTAFLEDYASSIGAVTPERAQAALREGLRTDGLLLVVVGNASLASTLEPLVQARGGEVKVLPVDALFEESAP